ncbi:MG2 domain-containing protein [Longimicrobium sp.]|uniref:alpha-2-macroglobulin family protein n=1 Tax=Longimicrobium sp. TaxID=2029185 RepID=UPI002CB6D1B0|nr:MG2 domain-containing protein [Longimicrobium sp.]HSU17587.1 MG2 domain-containing protein [Longimicrobium sp.]
MLRTAPTPGEPAEPDAPITVTFDRPVAGGLEDLVDAGEVFRISPSVRGKAEWRDPVTLRFTPDQPLRPGAEYRVTIASTFAAMDGGRLPRPHRFTFRVAKARVLTGDPVGPSGGPGFLPPRPVFRVLLSSTFDARDLATARVEPDTSCHGGTVVPLRLAGQHRISADDPEWFRYYGFTAADSTRDLRRVAELAPERPLLPGCRAQLVIPARLDSVGGEPLRWSFATYGPLRVLHAGCPENGVCHYGPATVVFSTPVRGADVLRHVRVSGRPFAVRDTAEAAAVWVMEGRLNPRAAYTISVDAGLEDVFGQRLPAAVSASFQTPGVPPSVVYPHGKMIVERRGFGTLAVQHVNVDTLLVTVAAVPERMEARFLSRGWGWADAWKELEPGAGLHRVPVRSRRDASAVTGVRLPVGDARRQRGGTLLAVRVGGRGVDTATAESGGQPLALVQVTDLAVHARVGVDQAVVWVTGVNDGRARGGVEVQLHDTSGAVRASGRTDGRGLAVLSGFHAPPPPPEGQEECGGYCGGGSFEGYVSARDGGDRAVVGVNEYDPDLAPYEFGVGSAWGEERAPTAGAVFTERGIYRPGEPVYARAIVRRGPLGALLPPGPGDSLRWSFSDRDGHPVRDTVVALSRFGTAGQTFRLPPDVPLGQYGVEIQARRDGRWRRLGYTSYQVAEYRPPEFLVDATAPREAKFAGDEVRVTVGGRYLFGAPMARSPLRWTARQTEVGSWALQIPGTDGYQLGEEPNWWSGETDGGEQSAGSGVDTLDARGYRELAVRAAPQPGGRPAMLTVEAEVVDANRQTVAASTSVMVHPAEFYLGAKPQGKGYFWPAGVPVRVDVIAVRPDGHGVAGVAVEGTVARREWHSTRRMRGGVYDEVGEWVTDTVATCRLTTGAAPAPCAFTPREGGDYTVTFATRDRKGRAVRTSLTRWVVGPGWVPWNDEGKFRMEVVPDRQRYAVGDTATVLIAAPFTNAEAWVTVERERVLRHFRIRVTSGTQTVKIPITEALAPNAYVSVVMVRGRSARPGTVDDPGRPTLRVGYAELKVTPEVKRLAVTVQPLLPEYRPGDTARVRVRLRDAAGRPQAGEVTVWAVDEGVLSLTGYQTPDPIDLIYQPRGLGMRLASNLVSVAPQVPEGQKGARNPGGSGGRDAVGVLRSVFRPTAFFIGSVVTDANGEAVVSGLLPDNITTFRVMALAVTAGDRYGSGHAPLLATRPLLARPSLPRFLREGDDFMAGVVVNHRFPGGVTATVSAQARGVSLLGGARQTLSLGAGRGAEALFHFHAIAGDTARFRFDASGNGAGDAVQVGIPIHPANRPVTQAVSGVLRDTATVEFELPAETDLSRSRLVLGFGTSPLAMVQAYQRWLDIYPYECSEQVTSRGLPLVTLYRAQRASGATLLKGDARPRIEQVVRTLSGRQREDGGIGLWSQTDWTTPWLTAYAGRVLLDAREAGFPVRDTVLNGIASYLTRALHEPDAVRQALGVRDPRVYEVLAERLAAADFLSRMGRPDVPSENLLLGQAARMTWEDRVALAEVLARRGAREPALRLLDAAWAGVRVRGTRAYLPPAAYDRHFYFASPVRPAARLLTATLELRPGHPMLGALVETVVQQGREEGALEWTTQDYGAAVLALYRFERAQRGAPDRMVSVRQGGRVVARMRARRGQTPDSTSALTGLVSTRWDGRKVLRVQVRADGAGPAVYYQLAVREVVGRATYRPLDRGIAVERWYETVDSRRPVTSVAAGQVVRVRLRITIPEDRSMVVLDDPLPAGLEAVDLSLRTVSPFASDLLTPEPENGEEEEPRGAWYWGYGSWDSGMWTAFDHTEIRDDRVVYFARRLWRGSYDATYLARATTAGRFVSAPAQAEEMYNPGVHGRSGGGLFTVRPAGR